jgi:uncharacterized protein
MGLLLDSGAVYAYYVRDDRWHGRVRGLLDADPGPFMLPAVVVPEVDHLLGRAVGPRAQLALYEDIVNDVYLVADLAAAGYERVLELNRRFADLELGFVDAAVAALAEQLGVSYRGRQILPSMRYTASESEGIVSSFAAWAPITRADTAASNASSEPAARSMRSRGCSGNRSSKNACRSAHLPLFTGPVRARG